MSIFKRKDPSALQQQLAKFDKKGFEADKAEWRLSKDKEGSGTAIIRFLPAVADDATTINKITTHSFQRSGKWYIENCPSTHGDYDGCPACRWLKEQNWSYDNEADRNAMYQSGVTRKTNYWANILIIKDSANPENEGKVFKYRFGAKIFEKINVEAAGDADAGIAPCDVTCPFDGKNFYLKVKTVGKHPNYDDCKFLAASPIPNIEDEAFQQQLFDGMHDIMTITAKDKFKSNEELTTNFNRIMGATARAKTAANDFDEELSSFEAKQGNKAAAATAVAATATVSTDEVDPDLDALLDEI